MRALFLLLPLLVSFIPTYSCAADSNSPYIEISVHGIEEVAPPLNRLADAIENLSENENLSPEDQQKIIAIIGELKTLGDKLDNTIQTTKEKVSQTQQEISTSISQMIMLTLAGLVVCLTIICGVIFMLFRLQIAPLVTSTSASLEKFAAAMDNLSAASRQISAKNRESTG